MTTPIKELTTNKATNKTTYTTKNDVEMSYEEAKKTDNIAVDKNTQSTSKTVTDFKTGTITSTDDKHVTTVINDKNSTDAVQNVISKFVENSNTDKGMLLEIAGMFTDVKTKATTYKNLKLAAAGIEANSLKRHAMQMINLAWEYTVYKTAINAKNIHFVNIPKVSKVFKKLAYNGEKVTEAQAKLLAVMTANGVEGLTGLNDAIKYVKEQLAFSTKGMNHIAYNAKLEQVLNALDGKDGVMTEKKEEPDNSLTLVEDFKKFDSETQLTVYARLKEHLELTVEGFEA